MSATARAAALRRVAPARSLQLRQHAELERAIQRRQWFDPWVFELTDDVDAERDDDDDVDEFGEPTIDAVYPWVAGFATALELFPELMALDARQLTEPLALVYRHLAPDDLEDADDLLAEIESLEPPADLSAAVEELVRAVLLLADVARPLAAAAASRPRPPARADNLGSTSTAQRIRPFSRVACSTGCQAARKRCNATREALDQHLRALHVGYPLDAHRHCRIECHPVGARQQLRAAALARRKARAASCVRASARTSAVRRTAASRPSRAPSAGCSRRPGSRAGAARRRAGAAGARSAPTSRWPRPVGIAPGAAARLHQQAEQPLGRAEVAGEQRAVGVDRRHQRDAAKVVALGDHLRAHQHVDLAGVHRAELRFQRAFEARAVGVHAGDARPVGAGGRRASSSARCSSSRSVPRPTGAMSRLPQSGQARGTRSVKPQWWQRSVRSILWNTRQALQCGHPLFQPQSAQCSTGA